MSARLLPARRFYSVPGSSSSTVLVPSSIAAAEGAKGNSPTVLAAPSLVQSLPANDPRVKKLFRPFIPLDFLTTKDKKSGSTLPPNVSVEELKELRLDARLFGLDPSRDLALPTPAQVEQWNKRISLENLTSEELTKKLSQEEAAVDRSYLDPQVADELARLQDKRRRRDEKRQDRDDKQKVKLVMRGKWDQLKTVLDQEAERQDREEGEPQEEMIPLRMLPKNAQAAHRLERLETIERLVAGMDERIASWKKMRRENRRKMKQAAPPF